MLASARALLRHTSAVTSIRPARTVEEERKATMAQAMVAGGLALATLWTGGTALAQVAELTLGTGPVTSEAVAAKTSSAGAVVGAEVLAQQKAQAEQKRQVLMATVNGLLVVAADGSVPLQAQDPKAALDQADAAATLRSDQLKRALRVLGLRPGALGGDQAQPLLIKANDPHAISRTFGVDGDFAARLRLVAERVRASQALKVAVERLPLAAPVASPVLSSRFGTRSDPFTAARAFHAGQDFSGAYMTRIDVTAPGIVSFTGQRSGYGNTVEVDHGGGYKTRYAHLAAIAVRVGQSVGLGDRLGGMGSTGRSTGTHLHYEVWANGQVQNPDRFLRAGQALTGGEGWTMATSKRSAGRRYTQLARNVERRLGRVHARFGG